MDLLKGLDTTTIPKLYATEDVKLRDKIAVAKFFDPTGRGTWFVLEGDKDGDDWCFFTWCVSPFGPTDDELGYVMLSDLQSVKPRARATGANTLSVRLGIERDLHFQPKPLGQIPGLQLPEASDE